MKILSCRKPRALGRQTSERGAFLFATISILETVVFTLSVSVVEELRPRWPFLLRS